MKNFCLLLTILPLVSMAADETDLWPSISDIPHYQESQIAIQPNMKSSSTYRIDKRGMPYLRWYTKPSGATTPMPCIILVSGGAYNNIGDFSQPFYGDWQKKLTAAGIQCVDLFYRTPRPEGLPIYQSAWDDGQRAVRVIRSQAESRGIDPDKIGVIAMSAGSHMATLLATSSKTNAYEPADEIDQISPRINVALANAIAYGMSDGLTGPNTNDGIGATLDTIFKFDDQTCPMCMTQGGKDPYSPISSSMVWRKLREKGVMTELHIYPDKEHSAFGLNRHIEFLRKLGWISSESAVSPSARWADDSSRGSTEQGTTENGLAMTWHHPAVHQTASVQILLEGPSAASAPVSDAIVYARRYLNATGITVVTAQVRSGTAVADAQEIVRTVRAGAASRGLNAEYVGLMGFREDAATAFLAATTTVTDCKARWAVAVSPSTGLADAPLATIKAAPALFIHEENNTVDSPVGSVASWEKQRELYAQGAVHTLAGEGADFITAASVPGTGAYTYLERVRDFLSDKNDLAAWTEPEEEEDPEEDPEDDPKPQIVLMPWFDVGFTNDAFVAGADWIAQSADPAGGVFAAADGVESELVKSDNAAYVSFVKDKEGEITYTPSRPSASGRTVHVSGRAKVESMSALPEADSKAGLCFIGGTPYGLAGGNWTKINNVQFAQNSWVDYEVELDFASENAPRVRYTVGDSVGEWIAIATTDTNVSRVRFLSGSFASFKGEYERRAGLGFMIIVR